MSSAKVALAATVAAVGLSACGTVAVKPSSGTGSAAARGKVDDPRTTHPNHVKCLQQAGFPISQSGPADLVVGTGKGLVHVHFEPTAGAAQSVQMQGADQGAEVIGSALLYPGQAPDSELTAVEHCVAAGVKG